MGADVNRLHDEMNRLISRCGFDLVTPAAFPRTNVWVDAENVHVECELPGVKPEELEIELLGDQELLLKGKRERGYGEEVVWHKRERDLRPFERTFELPVAVDGDQVKAEFNHGVLMITLPKRAEAKARKIVIKG
jgi:HSP20 family protein